VRCGLSKKHRTVCRYRIVHPCPLLSIRGDGSMFGCGDIVSVELLWGENLAEEDR